MRKFLAIISIGLLLVSCNSEDDALLIESNKLDQQIEFNDFNWISGEQTTINIEVKAPNESKIDLEDQLILLRNEDKIIVAFSFLDKNNSAQFELSLPERIGYYEFYLPSTKDVWAVEWVSNQTLELKDYFDPLQTSNTQ